MPESVYLARLEGLYSRYLETVEELERNRKLGEGLLGLKGGPADNPCHDRFAEDVKAVLDSFAKQEPPSAGVRAVLAWMYEAPKTGGAPQCAYWMLVAVQGFTRGLLSRLSREDAAALAGRFEQLYPSYERVPAQAELLKELRRIGGIQKRGLFGRR